MTIILAIETSNKIASVALLQDKALMFCSASNFCSHSQVILPMVQKLLTSANIKLSRCDTIAFGVGPGLFSGIRTAFCIAHGLAFGLDIPVIPIVTLKAMAQACLESVYVTNVLPILNARMNTVYWAQYEYFNGVWKTISMPIMSSILEVRPIGNTLICGNALNTYKDFFLEKIDFKNKLVNIIPHASQVAILGYHALKYENIISMQSMQPFYLDYKI